MTRLRVGDLSFLGSLDQSLLKPQILGQAGGPGEPRSRRTWSILVPGATIRPNNPPQPTSSTGSNT